MPPNSRNLTFVAWLIRTNLLLFGVIALITAMVSLYLVAVKAEARAWLVVFALARAAVEFTVADLLGRTAVRGLDPMRQRSAIVMALFLGALGISDVIEGVDHLLPFWSHLGQAASAAVTFVAAGVFSIMYQRTGEQIEAVRQSAAASEATTAQETKQLTSEEQKLKIDRLQLIIDKFGQLIRGNHN